MPVPSHVPPLLEYVVAQQQLDSLGIVEHSVRAAYFVEDGSYTLFKDSAHGVVGAFKTDAVVLISRENAVHVV